MTSCVLSSIILLSYEFFPKLCYLLAISYLYFKKRQTCVLLNANQMVGLAEFLFKSSKSSKMSQKSVITIFLHCKTQETMLLQTRHFYIHSPVTSLGTFVALLYVTGPSAIFKHVDIANMICRISQ